MADVATEPLSKVDSAIAPGDASPTQKKASHRRQSSVIAEGDASPLEKKISHRRTSSTVSGVFNINDLEKENVELQISPETQKLGWKLNTSPSTIEDKEVLKKLLVNPPIKKIDLQFPLGLEVTARNLKGVTIKDALDAIYKQFKKKADDELEAPYLAGFEWDREECYTRFIVHQKKQGESMPSSGKKKNKKQASEE